MTNTTVTNIQPDVELRNLGIRDGATIRNLRHRYLIGRNRYNLPATEALDYARMNYVLGRTDDFYVDVLVDDEPGSLVVALFDFETDDMIECLGGVDVEYTVSDHGNLHVDLEDPHIVLLAWDMARTSGRIGGA